MKLFAVILASLAFVMPVNAQSLEQIIGKRVIIGFPGSQISDASVQKAGAALSKGHIGGVILLGHNVKSPDQVKNLTSYFRQNSPHFTPFISIDQEGGVVQRLSKKRGFTDYPSAHWLSNNREATSARNVYENMAQFVRSYGFNVNFGPVLDLAIETRNQVIYKNRRSYGKDPSRVVQFSDAFIGAHHKYGVATSLKHFPGHGSSIGDTHKGFVDITKSWKSIELAPYDLLINLGYQDMVMIGHLYHSAFSDGQGIPTSLSAKTIRQKLRQELGFQGVVITDDMDMGAITNKWSRQHSIIRALQAGNDIILISNSGPYDPNLPANIIHWVKQAINEGQLSMQDLQNSYARIEALRARIR